VVASVKGDAELARALKSPCSTLFVLYGNVSSIGAITERAANAGKRVFANIDMIDGLSQRPAAVDFLRSHTRADGVLTTRAPVARAARTSGMRSILRFFMVDSFAYSQVKDQIRAAKPDAIEILPGCIPRVITWMRQDISLPIVAGGLVCDARDITMALRAGATAVATSNEDLWAAASRPGIHEELRSRDLSA